MSEEQIIALLTEIRDLQKQNVENYRTALQKQQEAIDFQRQKSTELQQIAARQKKVILLIVILTAIAFFIVASGPQIFKALLPLPTGR
jgi:hypothetical protein